MSAVVSEGEDGAVVEVGLATIRRGVAVAEEEVVVEEPGTVDGEIEAALGVVTTVVPEVAEG